MNYNKKAKKENLPIIENFKNIEKKIKDKKIKFIFMIALMVLTLISINIYDTISNYENPIIKNHAQLLVDKKEKFIQIEKSDFYYKDEMTADYKTLTDDDVNQIDQKLKKNNKIGGDIYRISNLHIESNNIMGYATNIYNLLEINPEFFNYSNPYTYLKEEFDIVEWKDFKTFSINDVIGNMPTNSDEIMISNYLADLLLTVGLKPYGEDNYYRSTSYEELVNSNKYFYFGTADKVKIVGIINYDLSEFQIFKNIGWDEYDSNLEKYNGIMDDLYYKTQNVYNKIYVDKDFISHLNVNDENTLGSVWKNKITKIGILIMEDSEKGFEKLLNEFKYDEPITARSTYSELVDNAMTLTDSLPKMSLISSILLFYIIILFILSSILFSRFVISKKDLKKMKNKKIEFKKVIIEIALISFITLLLSSIFLIIDIYILKNFMFRDNLILNQFFSLNIKQFIVQFLSMILIGIVSYTISIAKIKTIYKNNIVS